MSSGADFHDLVLGRSDTSFRSLFEAEWSAHLSRFPENFESAAQLRIGSRFRPCLVAWGYLMAGGSFDLETRREVARYAVYIELLHKATLLIDDLIDKDPARHGQPAFHVEFDDKEAILFAIYLLGDCVAQLTEVTKSLNSGAQNTVLALLGQAIKEMATGGIAEGRLAQDGLASMENVAKIIEMQTISLVKNGLLVGYHLGEGDPASIVKIDSLGYDAGYMFQVLNDLEPFYGSEGNIAYKGRENTDFADLRKNHLVAVHLESLSEDDRKSLLTELLADPKNTRAILRPDLERRQTIAKIGQNLSLVRKNINRIMDQMPTSESGKQGFLRFVDFVLERALARLDHSPCQILSEILIR